MRPGNHVLLTATGLHATVVDVEQKSIVLESFPGNSSRLNEDVCGIPLTKNMLRALSFNDDKISDSWRGQGITIHLKKDGIFYGLRLLRNRTKIKYFHQLQNYIADFYATFKDQKKSLLFISEAILISK